MPKADICHDLCVVTTRMLTSETSSLFDSDGEAVGGYRDACALRGARTSKKISTLNDKARSGRAYVGEVDASEKCGEVPEVVNGSGEYLERTIGQRSSGARQAACAEMRGAYSGLVLWHGRFWGAGLPLLSLCRSASAEPWWDWMFRAFWPANVDERTRYEARCYREGCMRENIKTPGGNWARVCENDGGCGGPGERARHGQTRGRARAVSRDGRDV